MDNFLSLIRFFSKHLHSEHLHLLCPHLILVLDKEKTSRILITGSEGFIGKNVYRKLVSTEGVTTVTSLEKDYMNHIGWESTLSKCVEDCDAVLHIGAISDTMLKDPNEMLKYNYLFSKELFDLAQIYDKKVVYSSSAANTGESGTPSNIYGWSKYITEQYGMAKVKDFIALRYFS